MNWAVFFTVVWTAVSSGDIQEAVKGAGTQGTVILPPTAQALPEDTAWQMIYTEGGVLAVVLATGVMVLWRLVSRVMAKTQEQNEHLTGAQVEAIARLGDAVTRVETAIKMSDLNNQNAIGRLSDSVNAATARIDKHEAKLEATASNLMEHSHRIKLLESGSHLVLPPVPSGRKRREEP